MEKLDNQVRQNMIPPGQREENLEAENRMYEKRVSSFRNWLDHNGSETDKAKFAELFGERDE